MPTDASMPDSIEVLPPASTSQPQRSKRTRVLLSCGPCRASKLKCDRQDPCSQCAKKCKPEGCRYAPRPVKPQKPAKSMAARLRRLEGMVRGMLDEEGGPHRTLGGVREEGGERRGPVGDNGTVSVPASGTDVGGQVIRGDLGATSYVGGTHFAAILQDIDELKAYFEYSEDEDGDADGDSVEAGASPEFLLLAQTMPRNREELLALLPEKNIIDRLMMRYFNSNSPSSHILHKLTFSKEYNEFWQDPHSVSLHWIALLFMVLSLGVFLSTFQAPQELETDSQMAPMDRFKVYRGAAGTALMWGKYSQPNQCTVQAMLLYVETEFISSRQSQMKCFLLSAVLIRLMLKMGLHRDPSKLPNITPYDGEMRRRAWNLAIQIDLLAAFHLGLPAMIHGIESDTSLPNNILDTDFDENSKELPLARPASDYTPLSYPINKAALCQVFGLVARQAHSLKVPTYEEVMRLDTIIEETYNAVPAFMKLKPLEKSITDSPMQVMQRFGLASLYQKSRCVLHRRYIATMVPKKMHEYSKRTCLSAALALLSYQETLHDACKPGGMLSPNGWFISTLAVNDFLLAGMVVALMIQAEQPSDVNGEVGELTDDSPIPTRDELLTSLKRSSFIWQQMAAKVPDCRKAAELVGAVTRKIELQKGCASSGVTTNNNFAQTSDESDQMAALTIDNNNIGLWGASLEENGSFDQDVTSFLRSSAASLMHGHTADNSIAWMPGGILDGGPGISYDWSQLDTFGVGDQSLNTVDQPQSSQAQEQSWLERDPLEDLDFLTRNVTGTTSFGHR